MKKPEFPRERWSYDTYKAFHINQVPIIFFDTGELICTTMAPCVGDRHHYFDFNVELCTTKDCGTLWTPEGIEVKAAWLDDNGQQYLMVDHDEHVAVRLDGGQRRYRNPNGQMYGSGGEVQRMPGVPDRFQCNAYGYIGGPGCKPVGNGKIAVRFPHKVSLTVDEREHVTMLVNTFRAAMKLTDDPCVKPQWRCNPIDLDVALKCQTWQDVPEALKADLFHGGVARRKSEYDYLLTEQPK